MTVTDESDGAQLAHWWDKAGAMICEFGIPLLAGGVTRPRGSIMSLDLCDGIDSARAVLDALRPRLCLWSTERAHDGEVVEYTLALLVEKDWHLLSCGTPADQPDDYSEDDAEDAPDGAADSRVRELIDSVIEELGAAAWDGDHEFEDVREELETALLRTLEQESSNVRRAYELARFRVWGAAARTLQRRIQNAHRKAFRMAAETHARAVLRDEPDLRNQTKTSRRDAVYGYLLDRDPTCTTKAASEPVAVALERLIRGSTADQTLPLN